MEWISVKDKLPDHGRNVLATYKNSHGKNRIIVGHYLERFKEESDCSDDCHDEYHEESDGYYYCEGWYERQDNNNDFSSMFVSEGEVSHWMPLLKAPMVGCEPEEPQTCLNCLYEPEWFDRPENLDMVGNCLWPKNIKHPPHIKIRVEYEFIFKSEPHKNCPAWRPK